jgi:hypothetical protein
LKTIIALALLICPVAFAHAASRTYSCTSPKDKVALTFKILNEDISEVDVTSPFQIHLECNVNKYTEGQAVITGLSCGQGDNIPDIVAIDEKSLNGMVEIGRYPHYDVTCK